MDLIEARHHAFATVSRHPWERARAEVIRGLIARHLRMTEGTVVLDVGCGDTFVVEQLAAAYPHVLCCGVDTAFTADLMQLYARRLGATNVMMASSLDAVALPPNSTIALVMLMDVLEHVADDRGLLVDLLARSDMADGATLLVTVPAYASLFCAHDAALGHYRRYSLARLRALLSGVGLRVVESGYFFGSLLPLRAIQVVKERLLGRREPTSDLVSWHGSPPISALLTRLLVADARAGMCLARHGLPLPGLSAYAVCRTSA